MRWLVLAALVALGCPAPTQYAVRRPGLDCARATRVAHKTLETLGYTVDELVEPSAVRTGLVGGTKKTSDGEEHRGRVVIRCDAEGAVLQPVEDALVPTDYEFSRAFGYSFKTLVQRPDVETPWKSAGLEVLVQALDPVKARLDLGDVPTVGGAVPVRVTVRNGTNRPVRLDPARLSLVDAAGASHEPLSGSALAAALAPNAAADRLRTELFDARAIRGGETRAAFLVFPAGSYREARVAIEDVETDETEGFVTRVE